MHLSVLSLDEEETGRLAATDLAWTAENVNLKRSGNSDSFVSIFVEVKWSRSVVSDSLWPHGL